MTNSLKRPLSDDLGNTTASAALALVILLAVGVGWASNAPLSGAVVTSGIVEIEGDLKTIQHLEGGIISEILVGDGDSIQAGQTLIRLDKVKASAKVDELRNQLLALAGKDARLRSERAGLDKIRFIHPMLSDLSDPDTNAVATLETSLFEIRRENHANRIAILENRNLQLEQQRAGINQQLSGIRKQLSTIRAEKQSIETLVTEGLESKSRLYPLQRTEAELLSNQGQLLAALAQSEEKATEIQLQILNLGTERLAEIDEQLAVTRDTRLQLEDRFTEKLDSLSRTDIVSPVSGIVHNLQFMTKGGVIKPGETLMEIVPVGNDLVIAARVKPTDIENIRIGQSAFVVFSAFPQRYMNRIEAHVAGVSADILEDPRRGDLYYESRIIVDQSSLDEVAPDIALTPGMPAEVFIRTGSRTFLDYMTQPIKQFFRRAMRES